MDCTCTAQNVTCVYVLQDLNAQLDRAESELATAKEKISTTEQQLVKTREELEGVS